MAREIEMAFRSTGPGAVGILARVSGRKHAPMAHRLPPLPDRKALQEEAQRIAAEASAFAERLAENSSAAAQDAGTAVRQLMGDLAHHFAPLAHDLQHRLGRRAHQAGVLVRRDPVPAIVAVGTAALIATLLLRRR
jgi:hypothetical protein